MSANDAPAADPFATDPLTTHRRLEGGDAIAVHRPDTGRVRIALPYQRGTRQWLRDVCGPGTRPEWDPDAKVWTVARRHFHAVVTALSRAYTTSVDAWADVVVRHGCDPRCENAKPTSPCSCSCLGENHAQGEQVRGWARVEDTAAGDRVRRRYLVPVMEEPEPEPETEVEAVNALKARIHALMTTPVCLACHEAGFPCGDPVNDCWTQAR